MPDNITYILYTSAASHVIISPAYNLKFSESQKQFIQQEKLPI